MLPHYQGLGIANLPATIAALLGAELPGACPPLERELWAGWQDGLKRVVLVVLDALGYLQLQAAMAQNPDLIFHRLAEAGRLMPITSTFPSTTNTVLTTLWTGYSPAAHGVLAYELYLRELGVAASALFFWPIHYRQRDALADWGLEAEEFVPVPGLAKRLANQGIDTYGLISKAYGDSFLSRMHRRGVKKTPGFCRRRRHVDGRAAPHRKASPKAHVPERILGHPGRDHAPIWPRRRVLGRRAAGHLVDDGAGLFGPPDARPARGDAAPPDRRPRRPAHAAVARRSSSNSTPRCATR